MGRLMIFLCTIIAVGAMFSNRENNSRVITIIKNLFIEINMTYLNLFKEKSKVTRWLQGSFFIFAEIMTIIGALGIAFRSMDNDITKKTFLIPILIIVIVIAVHLSIGYLLLVLTNIQLFITKIDNRNLKTELLIAYFIISTYFFTLIIFPDDFENTYITGLIGLAMSYYLNMKVLIKLIRNPKDVHSEKRARKSGKQRNSVVIASILLLIMIVLNLFLAVNLINSGIPGSFSNNPSNFDLFYYTIVTFTTIGYGDIVPLTIAGKIITIVISITSVVCLTVFLSSVLSSSDEK
ncbi:potassium channel family protein [Clostridium sardiniense]|uniref:potassium channel family protein n=1 Tax=Clostridium sardiniense TaxID=29369 RepID=UPI003D3585A4